MAPASRTRSRQLRRQRGPQHPRARGVEPTPPQDGHRCAAPHGLRAALRRRWERAQGLDRVAEECRTRQQHGRAHRWRAAVGAGVRPAFRFRSSRRAHDPARVILKTSDRKPSMSRAFDEVVVADPRKWAVFLDIDGTLIDVAPDPKSVRIPAELPGLLAGLSAALGGALALNTGREIKTVDGMLRPLRLPASGVHGSELRLAAGDHVEILAPRIPEGLTTAVRQAIGPSDTMLVEDKSVGLAVHYRKVPDAVEFLGTILSDVVREWPAYQLKGGRMIYEIIPRGFSKATSIAKFLESGPFHERVPLVIGDDRGDEPAIAFAKSKGGAAFTVAGEYFPSCDADFASTIEVRSALARLLRALAPAPLEKRA
ncbi:MAG: trehalose-phosphatase [Hyphomicrobiales bacterium]|nr:MAG: trehalose-phosphatase [Hyphomicrobiales bacterium]